MSKIVKSTIKWVDLHPRAERLLEGAGIATIGDNSNDPAQDILDAARHAFVCGAYMAADQLMNTTVTVPEVSSQTHRNPDHIQKHEYRMLPQHAVDAINGVITRLKNGEYEMVDLRAQASKLANAMAESMDAIDVLSIWTDEGWMPTPADLDAISEAEDQADIDAGNNSTRMPMRLARAKKARHARANKWERAAAIIDEDYAKAHAIELQARRERERDKRAGVHPAPISWYVRKINNGGSK
jgi:hypothetical protein